MSVLSVALTAGQASAGDGLLGQAVGELVYCALVEGGESMAWAAAMESVAPAEHSFRSAAHAAGAAGSRASAASQLMAP